MTNNGDRTILPNARQTPRFAGIATFCRFPRIEDVPPANQPIDWALYGIPFGVKDIIEAAGLPMSCGSPIYQGHVARRDAAPVALLQEAGGVCLGKTVTTELVTPGSHLALVVG